MSRSLKKSPYVSDRLMKRVQELNEKNEKKPIKTWSRNSVIYPEFVGSGNPSSHSFALDNSQSLLQSCKKIDGFSEFYSLSVPIG